jgi:hypothetical protein
MAGLHGRTAWLPAAVLFATVALAGCTSSAESSAHGPAASTSDTAGSTLSRGSGRPPCPNSEGGACLGPLEAGREYTTDVFHPVISYRVPTDGWFNYEDTPGNFLLVPPGSDLPGVNAGTSDFIGVYRAIAPSRFRPGPGCNTSPVPGIAATPDAVAAWIGQQPLLDVTAPAPVEVGGLHGLVVDIRAQPAPLPTCQLGNETIEVVLLFSGVSPSSLDHGVIHDMTMRLYLLDYQDQVLAIEVDDIDAAPADLDSLSSVAEGLSFSA